MNELVQILKNTRQHLMTGVSHMIPFVVSGGILLAVSVMLYGKGAVPDAVADPNLKKLFDIGVAGLTLMVPFLAAYIGYSIAERFAGKTIVRVNISDAVKRADAIMSKIEAHLAQTA
ncbi:TPA: hypothetical protein JS307_004275 [Escherichia coli]|nr:hypothetical protein [Escherichia coli]